MVCVRQEESEVLYIFFACEKPVGKCNLHSPLQVALDCNADVEELDFL